VKIDEEDKKTKIDDDFLKIPMHQWNVQDKSRDRYGTSRVKEFFPSLLPVSLVLVILVAVATGYLWTQVSALGAGIKNLNLMVNTMDVGSLKSRVIIAETTLEQLNKENGHLKAELAKLTNEMDTLKARQRERAEAAAQKQAAPKKKPVVGNKRPR
jgi:cell division protein FtsB